MKNKLLTCNKSGWQEAKKIQISQPNHEEVPAKKRAEMTV